MNSFLKKISFGKIINFLLLKLSYWFSIITKKVHIWGSPFAVSIEPVNYCNLRCPECFAGNGTLTRNKQMLDINCFQKIMNQLPAGVSYLTLYFQGEPLLNPHFSELVHIAHKKALFISTSTNGHYLSDHEKTKNIIRAGLDRLIISVDGTTQEVYEKYRKNGNLEKVIEGIKAFAKLKEELHSKTPVMEIQFLVMAHNEHQIAEIKELASSLKVDKLALKTAQVYDFENGNELIPANQKYSRYQKGKDGKYHIKGRLKNNCWRQWSSVVITVAGEVLPCCFDKNGVYSFGNILECDLDNIWKGEKANLFRQAILKNRKNIDICFNCTEI